MENDAKYFYNKATVYNDEGKYTLAIDNFKKALEQDPHSIEIIFNLGVAYLNKKEYDSGIECFENVLNISPDEAAAFSNLALSHAKKHDFEKAILYYQKVLAINPEDTGTFKDLGDSYVKNRQYDEAIQYYEKFLQHHPTSFIVKESLQTAINLKNSLGKGTELKEATVPPTVNTYSAGKELTNSPEEYINMAVNCVKEQNIDMAIENLRNCLKIDPDNKKAGELLNKLFELKQKQGNTVKKEEIKTAHVFVDYQKANEYLTLGIAYFNVNNYNMALENFKKCLEINPNDYKCKGYVLEISAKIKESK